MHCFSTPNSVENIKRWTKWLWPLVKLREIADMVNIPECSVLTNIFPWQSSVRSWYHACTNQLHFNDLECYLGLFETSSEPQQVKTIQRDQQSNGKAMTFVFRDAHPNYFVELFILLTNKKWCISTIMHRCTSRSQRQQNCMNCIRIASTSTVFSKFYPQRLFPVSKLRKIWFQWRGDRRNWRLDEMLERRWNDTRVPFLICKYHLWYKLCSFQVLVDYIKKKKKIVFFPCSVRSLTEHVSFAKAFQPKYI